MKWSEAITTEHLHSHQGCSHNTLWASAEPRPWSWAKRCNQQFPWTTDQVSPFLHYVWGLSPSVPAASVTAWTCFLPAPWFWSFYQLMGNWFFFFFVGGVVVFFFYLWLFSLRACKFALCLCSWSLEMKKRESQMSLVFCFSLGSGVTVIRGGGVLCLSNGGFKDCHLIILVTTEMPLQF